MSRIRPVTFDSLLTLFQLPTGLLIHRSVEAGLTDVTVSKDIPD